MSNYLGKILITVLIVQLIVQAQCMPPPVIEDLVEKLATVEKGRTTTPSNSTEDEITTVRDEDDLYDIRVTIEAYQRCAANQEFVNGECREVLSLR